ncbi:hypothetical protein BS47DRAFT_1363446 [Hydnum rufescens UP504]|uniref:Uncharacterized protein n=1 Tax=Hydnum rufescens UP504 TaxID=1448309 RepID=A0A9P6DRC9_9AGAM|nr:hypothetical protein BS47DRAFT_1363446 [Hydnum rufescens UP504]
MPLPHLTTSGHAIGGVLYAKHTMVKRHVDHTAWKMTTIQQKCELAWHHAVVRSSQDRYGHVHHPLPTAAAQINRPIMPHTLVTPDLIRGIMVHSGIWLFGTSPRPEDLTPVDTQSV